MNYSKLTKIQKRCIDAFIKLKPELETCSEITRPEIEDLFKILFDARESGGEKIGYPMWLVKGDKSARGVYKFPAPGLSVEDSQPASKTKMVLPAVKVEEEDKEFFTDLKTYGIMETA